MYVYIKTAGVLFAFYVALSFLYFAAHGTSCFAASRILDGRTFRQCVFIIEIHLFPNRYEPGRQGRLRFAAG